MSSVGEARQQLFDKKEEAYQNTCQPHTHTHSPHHPLLPHPPISPLTSLVLPSSFPTSPPLHCPAKLTAPSSVENESHSHYNRAGQIPLALSEIEHGEQGAGGSGARPLSEGEGELL